MKNLGIGKIKGLQDIATADGIFTICAMDHRGSFSRMINKDNPASVSYDEMVNRKLELCSNLAKHASALLLDPLFGAAQCISHGALPGSTGLLVSIEASGYGGGKENRTTELLEDWGVEKIKRMGASAVKILVYYRPDLEELAARQRGIVEGVARECIKYDIPCLVEPICYPVGSEVANPEEFTAIRSDIIIRTAREMTSLPIDVLKSEFPATARPLKDRFELLELCQQLDEASRVPWVILSAGVGFQQFSEQVEIACQAGASGFLGGRAVWQEVMNIDDAAERVNYLSTTGADRMKNLNGIAGAHAVPWYKKYGVPPHELSMVSEGWYQEY